MTSQHKHNYKELYSDGKIIFEGCPCGTSNKRNIMKMEEYTGRHYKDFEDYKSYYKSIPHVTLTDSQLLTAHEWFFRASDIRETIKKNGKGSILDVGCHTGVMSLNLAKIGMPVTGIDLHPKAIEECISFCKRYDINNCEWICTAFEDFKSEKKYDYVIIAEIIEHVLDPLKLLDFAETMGRIVMVSTPEYNGVFGRHTCTSDGQHIRCYKHEELKYIISRRGEILDYKVNDIIYISYKPYEKSKN